MASTSDDKIGDENNGNDGNEEKEERTDSERGLPKKRTALAAKRRADDGVRGAVNEMGGDDVDEADSSETTTDGRLCCNVSEVTNVGSSVVDDSADTTADADNDTDSGTGADDDDDDIDDDDGREAAEEVDETGSGRVGVARDRMRARF